MTNTSKDNNIRFIVTNIEKTPSEVPPSMTTPPPDRPTSSKNTNEESAQNYQHSKQNVRRSLPFENPGKFSFLVYIYIRVNTYRQNGEYI